MASSTTTLKQENNKGYILLIKSANLLRVQVVGELSIVTEQDYKLCVYKIGSHNLDS